MNNKLLSIIIDVLDNGYTVNAYFTDRTVRQFVEDYRDVSIVTENIMGAYHNEVRDIVNTTRNITNNKL